MNDEDAIRAAVLDYVEGWFDGDAGRMDRALCAPRLGRSRVGGRESASRRRARSSLVPGSAGAGVRT
jgi:hypothetical protein